MNTSKVEKLDACIRSLFANPVTYVVIRKYITCVFACAYVCNCGSVCVHVCACVCVRACMCVCVCVRVCVSVCMRVCAHICMCKCVCMHVFMCVVSVQFACTIPHNTVLHQVLMNTHTHVRRLHISTPHTYLL